MQGRLIGGRYEIVRKIAEGGMGAVYEAQHNLSKKTVALKILFPHIGRDESARQRFMREVSAPAQIGHDGIVEVYDAGFDTQDGSLFVAMEMLRGETLRDRLARGGLTRDQVLDFFEQLLDPLAAAHAKGIVHRDLKPENVYLHKQRDGREVLKLLDFGIARDLDEKSQSVTQTGMAMGTPHYMAPEQAMSARGVSFPADVWAVGAMMYEALSGKPPFGGETASAIVVHAVSKPHEPLAHAAPATPAAIASLVDRCLSKEAEKRPRDAGVLLADLRAARGKAAGTPVSRAPSPALGPQSTPMAQMTAQVAPSPHAQHATPQPPGGFVPTPHGPTQGPITSGYGTAPMVGTAPMGTPPPGYGTPAPAVSSIPRKSSGGFGRIALVLGVLAALGLTAVVGVVVIGAVAAGNGAFTAGSGTVHLVTTIPGTVFVDGTMQGPVFIGGQDIPLASGTHLVEVRNAGGITVASANVDVASGQTAELQLSYGMIASSGSGGGPQPAGGTVTGTLGPGDQTLRTGEFMDFYEYQWTAGQHVHIELRGSYDTYLILRMPSGRQRDNDDAPGMGTDSMLDQTLEETGTYRILVTSYRPGQSGSYTLTVR